MARNNKRNVQHTSEDGFKTISKASPKDTYVNKSYNRAPKVYSNKTDIIRSIGKNTQHMISRLSGLIKAYETPEQVLDFIGVPGYGHILKNYMTEFPYYRLEDVCRVFDLGTVLPGHAFEIREMTIINGNIFLSIIGIYKALLLSDMTPTEKFTLLNEIDSPEFDTNWIIVNNMSNNPLPKIDSKPSNMERYVKHNLFYGNTEITLPYLSQLLLRAQYFSPLAPEIYSMFKKTVVQSHCGCVTEGNYYDHFKADNNSSGISIASHSGVRYIASKYRPIITKYSTDTLTALKVLCAHRARSFVHTIFAGDSTYYLYDNSEVFNKMCYTSLTKSGEIKIGTNIDNSTDNDIVSSCLTYDASTIQRCLQSGWTYEQIVLYHVQQ